MPPVHMLIAAAMLLTAAPLAYGQDTQQVEGPEATAPTARVGDPPFPGRRPRRRRGRPESADPVRRTPQRQA